MQSTFLTVRLLFRRRRLSQHPIIHRKKANVKQIVALQQTGRHQIPPNHELFKLIQKSDHKPNSKVRQQNPTAKYGS